jgi:Phage tail tube protein
VLELRERAPAHDPGSHLRHGAGRQPRRGLPLRSGAALVQVTGAKLAFSNGVETVRTIRADCKLEEQDPSFARAAGQVTVRFADTVLLAQAQNAQSAAFEFAYAIDASRSLTVTLHEVYLASPRPRSKARGVWRPPLIAAPPTTPPPAT